MTALVAHRLRLICAARSPVVLPVVRGPMLRGALVRALLDDFCPARGGDGCGAPDLASACPVCALIAPAEEEGQHGSDAPRPFTVEPTLGSTASYAPGDLFEFGLTLFGETVALLPYLLSGVTRMGRRGIGASGGQPGYFILREAWALDPLRGRQHRIMSDDEPTITMPDLPITHAAALERAAQLPCDAVTLELLTPLRLVSDGKLVHALSFEALLRRLLRRLDQLSRATTGTGLELPFVQVIEAAGAVRVTRDETRWLDVNSFSSRTGRATPIGGLLGRVTFAGELAPFLPWLVWGEIVHVGKDATKGNGWYRLTRAT